MLSVIILFCMLHVEAPASVAPSPADLIIEVSSAVPGAEAGFTFSTVPEAPTVRMSIKGPRMSNLGTSLEIGTPSTIEGTGGLRELTITATEGSGYVRVRARNSEGNADAAPEAVGGSVVLSWDELGNLVEIRANELHRTSGE